MPAPSRRRKRLRWCSWTIRASKLVDVRTNAERDWIGRPALPEGQHGAVQWSLYPGGAPNPDFAAQLQPAPTATTWCCSCAARACARAMRRAWRRSWGMRMPSISWKGFEGDRDALDRAYIARPLKPSARLVQGRV
jgi:hypothetical protein